MESLAETVLGQVAPIRETSLRMNPAPALTIQIKGAIRPDHPDGRLQGSVLVKRFTSEFLRIHPDLEIIVCIHYHPMDYWIAGLLDCCKSKSYEKITIWEKSKTPIMKFFLKSNFYGFP
jgi:hypothetical protein